MKSGTWILAACGVVATALTIALAQENASPGKPLKANPAVRPAIHKARSSAAVTGDATELPSTTPSSEAAAAAPGFPAIDAAARPAAPAPATPVRKAQHHPLSDDVHPLINADLKQNADGGAAKRIQQVGGTAKTAPVAADITPSDKAFDLSPAAPETAVKPKPEMVVKPKETKPLQQASYSTSTTSSLLSSAKVLTGSHSASVAAKWTKKGDLNVGQPCDCSIVVSNSGAADASDVVVEASLPATVRVTKAEPAPNEAKETAIWKFATLKAGETKTIQLTLIPGRRGDLQARATVRYTGLAAGSFSVKEPMLKVELAGPTEALVGDSASQFITVSNPGTGVAKNVAVEATIPAGLEHPRGERLVMDIGSLNPGESRKVRLSLTAVAGGDQKIKVKATAVAAVAQLQERVVKVSAPSLKVVLNGPGLRYVGRNAVYTLKATNDGTVATNNVQLVHKLPDGFKFVKTDNGGTFDAGKRTIAWFVGRVEPGKSVTVHAVLTSTKLGDYTHVAGAFSEQGVKAETTCKTKVDGTASLILEIVDLNDPIEVGAETGYEVRVRNDGSKAAGNVKIACELAKGVELVSAKGPTASSAKDGKITFVPLPSLEPGKTAIYRVQVKGTVAGDLRFRAHLSSDANSKTLTYDELTKFYGEK